MERYGFDVQVSGAFDEVVERVKARLGEQGFGVLSEIDVAATLKAKLGVDRPPYRILGACNPALARLAVDADPDIGLLLPCNVLVRQEESGEVTVAFMDPAVVLDLVAADKKQQVGEVATEAKQKLEAVRAALGS